MSQYTCICWGYVYTLTTRVRVYMLLVDTCGIQWTRGVAVYMYRLGQVHTPTVEYVYISYRDVHVLCGGHGGVAAYMYRLGYVYTLILEYVYICYSDIHVLYGGHIGVAVFMYRFRLCIHTHIRVRVYML